MDGGQEGSNPKYHHEVFVLGLKEIRELTLHSLLKFDGEGMSSIALVFHHSRETGKRFL